MITFTQDYTDKQLIHIFRNKDKSSRYFWLYSQLPLEQKTRIFDLLIKIQMKGGQKHDG